MSGALTAEQSRMCAALAPMVERFAHRLAGRFSDVGFAELQSAGNEGAVKSVLRHTPDKGPLEAYASAWIWNEMQSAARKTKSVWRREAFRPSAAHDPDPPSSGTPADEIDAFLAQSIADDLSNQVKRMADRAAAMSAAMLEHGDIDPEAAYVSRLTVERARAHLRQAVSGFPEPERTFYRLSLIEEMSLSEVAAALSIDKSKAQRLGDKVKKMVSEVLANVPD